jgi:hypothetical protein
VALWQNACLPSTSPCVWSLVVAGREREREREKSCLIPNFRESILAFSLLLWCWLQLFHIWSLLCWGLLLFLQGLYHEGILNFVKYLFYIYWDDCVIFLLGTIYVSWFAYVKLSLCHLNEMQVDMLYDLFDVLLNLTEIILRIFACIFLNKISL